MTYCVEVESKAAKQIRALAADTRDRVIGALEQLRQDPRPPGCAKLKGRDEPAWRIRVGDHRILYRVHDTESLVRVYGVLRRDEAYR